VSALPATEISWAIQSSVKFRLRNTANAEGRDELASMDIDSTLH
jgi:hypothetical protein